MKIADLFIAIGISGATQVKSTLGDTRKGLQETTSSAIWAKAALVGVLYGLERLVSASNRTGAEMLQFANFTGMSAEKLQRYAYAGRQFGASADEIKGSLMGVQKVMAQLETTGQGPKGLWVVGREVGLDKSRLRDTTYVFDQLQKFAQKSKLPIGIANEALESFGLSAGTIAAMRQNAFNPKSLGAANIYSDKETAQLNKMNAAWGNLGDKIDKAIGHLNVKHGGQLIKDITMVTDEVLKLTDALATLAKNAKFFEALGKSFEGWGIILKSLNETLSETNSHLDPKTGKRIEEKGGASAMMGDLFKGDLLWKMTSGGNPNFMNEGWRPKNVPTTEKDAASGAVVYQTNTFNGVKDAHATIPDIKRATSDSVRQSQAQRRKH